MLTGHAPIRLFRVGKEKWSFHSKKKRGLIQPVSEMNPYWGLLQRLRVQRDLSYGTYSTGVFELVGQSLG